MVALSFYNLVPSCSVCNHGKATDDIGVNPYFDGFQSKFGICDKTKNGQLNINEIKQTKSKDFLDFYERNGVFKAAEEYVGSLRKLLAEKKDLLKSMQSDSIAMLDLI